VKDVAQAKRRLESLIERLPLFAEQALVADNPAGTGKTEAIFIVHGHARGVREAVRSTIQALTNALL
jgi:hypothetical protein